MTPARWQQVKETLASALEHEEPAARADFLSQTCAEDTGLRREVEALLEHSPEVFESWADEGGFLSSDSSRAQNQGRRIGAYRLVRELGRGGMGAVWLAKRADEDFQKNVAIKLLKRGTDTDEVLRRFRAERQILARLEHPGIARLFDGGETDDGLPYFVMEYVEGARVTDHCFAENLTVPERLRLFQQMCGAVQFAHQNLIVHRDLKPANILVTAKGEPKLLDFGIAKLLTPGAEAWEVTMAGRERLTPAYASPEQIRGEPITTASDIYSLGTLLYELLCERPPHTFSTERPSPTELMRVICQAEPLRPSLAARPEMRRALRGDLETIVLRAMAKVPARRYDSVEQFSTDIRRYLEARPVRARPDTLGYRTSKFFLRNKVLMAGAALLSITLLAGIVATAREAQIANRERAHAERRFKQLRGLASSFLFDLDGAIAERPTQARMIVVERAWEYLNSLMQDAEGDRSLQRDLATAYQKLGDVQSQLHQANIGDSAGALESYRKALVLREMLLAHSPPEKERAQLQMELSLSYRRLGDILAKTGDTGAALVSYRKTLPLLESIAGAAANREVRVALASDYEIVGRTLLRTGDGPAAEVKYQQALRVIELLVREKPDDPAARLEQSKTLTSLGYLLAERGQKPEARDAYQQALEIVQNLAAADPANPNLRRLLMDSHEWLGTGLRDSGNLPGALEEYQQARALCDSALRADPANVQTHNDLADILHNIGNTLFLQHDAAGALEQARLARENYETVAAADPLNVHAQRQVWIAEREIAEALVLAGNETEALVRFRQAMAGFQKLAAQDRTNAEFQKDVVECSREITELSAAVERERKL